MFNPTYVRGPPNIYYITLKVLLSLYLKNLRIKLYWSRFFHLYVLLTNNNNKKYATLKEENVYNSESMFVLEPTCSEFIKP